MAIASINPATGETLRTFEPLSESETDTCVAHAADAFATYRRTTFRERARWLMRAAELLDANKERCARIITLEMGKPIRGSRDEVEKCAWACRYFAEHAERMLRDVVVETNAHHSFLRCQPLGPVLAIMPWNFPFWQVFRFAAPALMAGNVALLKHASNVPQCALAIDGIFREAGFPDGVFQALLIPSNRIPRLLDDERIAAATLTGSTRAGSDVASRAGRNLRKTVLELGGSDPFIVMASADFDAAVATAVKSRTNNAGQSCVAAKRFVVLHSMADRFEKELTRKMRELRVGDPMDEKTDVGPLAHEQGLRTVETQVQQTLAAGAKLLTGGKRVDGPGYFYAPTVITNVPGGTPLRDEEVFGPVATILSARDVDHAIRIANDTPYGLGSSVWTGDENERERFINELAAGMVFINGMVASDPRLPFGGIKNSGYGRELGDVGIKEFVNVKAVWIGGKAVRHSATE